MRIRFFCAIGFDCVGNTANETRYSKTRRTKIDDLLLNVYITFKGIVFCCRECGTVSCSMFYPMACCSAMSSKTGGKRSINEPTNKIMYVQYISVFFTLLNAHSSLDLHTTWYRPFFLLLLLLNYFQTSQTASKENIWRVIKLSHSTTWIQTIQTSGKFCGQTFLSWNSNG